jgi:molybdopterin converting factor small subunit
MSIDINYFGILASKMLTTKDSVEMSSGARIRDVFCHLIEKHSEVFKTYVFNPEGEKMNGDVLVNVNDVPILQKQGVDTVLNDGDQIDILPLFAGGG